MLKIHIKMQQSSDFKFIVMKAKKAQQNFLQRFAALLLVKRKYFVFIIIVLNIKFIIISYFNDYIYMKFNDKKFIT